MVAILIVGSALLDEVEGASSYLVEDRPVQTLTAAGIRLVPIVIGIQLIRTHSRATNDGRNRRLLIGRALVMSPIPAPIVVLLV